MTTRTLWTALLVTAFAVGGCSSDTRQSLATDLQSAVTAVGDAASAAANDAAEVLARNIATQQGEEQFKNAGQTLDGPLTCTATIADGVDNIAVDCTGTTQAGGAAVLTGTTNEIPGASVVALDGDFTGSVDGQEVFTTQHLGG
jgi:hypothetical protein